MSNHEGNAHLVNMAIFQAPFWFFDAKTEQGRALGGGVKAKMHYFDYANFSSIFG